MALTGSLQLRLDTVMTSPLDLSTSTDALQLALSHTIADGTGLAAANRHFSDRRALGTSANEDLDLSGSLTNAFGASLALTKLKAVVIINRSTAASITVRGAASNGVAGFMAGAHTLAPGAWFATGDLSAAGWTVTGGTGDLINVANLSGSDAASYDVYIVGSQ